jgi:hypothetical protein
LYGPKESGKGTVADYFVKTHGYQPLAFADALRDAVAGAYGLDRAWFRELSEDHSTKETPQPALNGLTPRQALIDVGTFYRDNVDVDHWARVALRRVAQLLNQGASVVVTDCRFANEAAAMAHAGGIVVGMYREDRWNPDAADTADAAVYRGWADSVDAVIINNRTPADLTRAVDRMVNASGFFQDFKPGCFVRVWNAADREYTEAAEILAVHDAGRFMTVKRASGARSTEPRYAVKAQSRYYAVGASRAWPKTLPVIP